MTTVYSNYDHVLDEAVASRLFENPGSKADHTAWEFHAIVWFDGEKWRSEVSRYGSVVETLTGDTILGVIREANARWGSE